MKSITHTIISTVIFYVAVAAALVAIFWSRP